MLQQLAITPPVLGRISIGHIVEKNDKRLPVKDDQFTITSQLQLQGEWLLHPLDSELRKTSEGKKLRSIPVRLLFNDPDLNFRAEYTLFDRNNGRPLCAGDGDTCRRQTDSGLEKLQCPGPSQCEFSAHKDCKPYGRLNVSIGDDALGSFIFRTTGYNSIRTLTARLSYYQAVSGDLLACMPLELKLRGKSTRQSMGTAIYYVDLTVREGLTLEEAIQQARALDKQRKEAGYDQAALDQAAKQGFINGSFEEDEDEVQAVVEEFYPEDGEKKNVTASTSSGVLSSESPPVSLKDKLAQRLS